MYEKYAGIGKKEFNHNLDSVVRLNVSDELWKKIAVAAQSAQLLGSAILWTSSPQSPTAAESATAALTESQSQTWSMLSSCARQGQQQLPHLLSSTSRRDVRLSSGLIKSTRFHRAEGRRQLESYSLYTVGASSDHCVLLAQDG